MFYVFVVGADGMDHDLHSESSEYLERISPIAGFELALIFTFVIVAACISSLAVILVLREHNRLQKTDNTALVYGGTWGVIEVMASDSHSLYAS